MQPNVKEARILILTALQGAIPAPYNKTAQGWSDEDYLHIRRVVKAFVSKTEKEFGIKAPVTPSHDPRD